MHRSVTIRVAASVLIAALAVVLVGAPPVRADDVGSDEAPDVGSGATSVEQRLRALEERLHALEAENARLKAAAIPAPSTTVPAVDTGAMAPAPAAATQPEGPVLVKAAGKEAEIKVGGFTQVQAEAGDRGDSRFSDDNDRLYLRRARVNVAGKFREKVEWKTELELAGTLQNTSSLRAQLTDAFVVWKPRPEFELRGGQFKTPFGFEHISPDPTLAVVERTLGSDRLTLGRQLGLQIGGGLAKGRFTWLAGAFNGVAANTSGNDDDRFLLAARLAGTPATWKIGEADAKWTLGANGYSSRDASVALGSDFQFDSNPTTPGNDNVFAGRRRAFGADTQLALGAFELWAEWMEVDFDPNDDLPTPDVDSRARTLQATYLTVQDKLQLVARWDDFDPNGSLGGDDVDTLTAGLSWLFRAHDLKLQANWMEVDGAPGGGSEGRMLVRFQVMF